MLSLIGESRWKPIIFYRAAEDSLSGVDYALLYSTDRLQHQGDGGARIALVGNTLSSPHRFVRRT